MILVLVPQLTNRLTYIFDFYFKELFKSDYEFTTDAEKFKDFSQAKFSYGFKQLNDELFFEANQLLFEANISIIDISFGIYKEIKTLFPVKTGALPFDPFAAGFYMITRYEEYLPHKKDRHNRYKPESSVAISGGFLEKPIVNFWALVIKEIINNKYPQTINNVGAYTFQPTLDIDNAYAYRYKGVLRTSLSLAQRLVKLEFNKLSKRIKIHMGKLQDPYDTYDKQRRIHRAYKITPNYFFLLGDYGKYDKNLPYDNEHMVKLVKSLGEEAPIGLHPSYGSNASESKLLTEKKRLESILSRQVTKSRQHYIKLTLPETYRNLLKAGIKEDYSMGYSTKIGFRAGTCSSFLFFDLEKNITTDLRIYPFAFMDSTLKFFLKVRSKEVINHVTPLVNDVKKVGGQLIFIFHNESLGNERQWKNWGEVYEKVIRLAKE
ncbi:MAG: polysaccharide deacetylase family protein [Sporocytophaga sp.]|uniref:polysaccharide deacetylase family protein n=1 Tax=Sporocytophaga sp. TaxID=2231183 RepID=UPI001B1F0DA8|nr:polysaccharide deacetylase family protein [Sporocytophaga sp.]MBO9701689.1 polysaccharide deacetylase family protein [Sporocytophaga sp.]